MKFFAAILVVSTLAYASTAAAAASGQWPPRDPNRPQPPQMRVDSALLGTPPPPDATVLFDGHGLGRWNLAGDPGSRWHQAHGLMLPGGKVFNWLFTKQKFGSVQVHLEFREPYPARGNGQERGNSGVRLMGVYEVQILDAYHNHTYADGVLGAIYAQSPPIVIPVRPSGKWQSMDIIFDAPRFSGSKLLRPPYITVLVDGLVVQNHQEIYGNTSANKVPLGFVTHGERGPLGLQDHGQPTSIVAFRNIWIRPLRRHGR